MVEDLHYAPDTLTRSELVAAGRVPPATNGSPPGRVLSTDKPDPPKDPLGPVPPVSPPFAEPEPVGVQCLQCGAGLHRSDQKYCSSACRSRYRRAQSDLAVTRSPDQRIDVTSEPAGVAELALRSKSAVVADPSNPFERWAALARSLPQEWTAEVSRARIVVTWNQ
jgi:hypothetical protein